MEARRTIYPYIQKKLIMMTRRILIIIACFFFFNSLFGQPHQKLKITHLTGNFYVFTTYNIYKGEQVSSNGMYLITNDGVILFDTPWDTTQFQPLLDSININHHEKVIACIATHFHADRTAGLEYYKSRGIKTYTTKQTDVLSGIKGMKRAEYLIYNDTVFNVGQYTFETYFPGEGHTTDNIVIWFPKERILYGGCLVKSVDNKNLGNLSDANVKAYATTIKRVQQKCKRPKYIIPGHDSWTSNHSVKHTLKMAEKFNHT